ncbi:MBL fold metallo-hydrolase [Deinococcus radiopugnans]|uniref:MBL fold metallo-hydrolase n=1 Tax=Deinococcus radiopugnans TaxID=57497 RepID=UPI00361985FC
MSLIALAPGIFYFPGAVNSFVVVGRETDALLVDTGLDDSHARKLLRAVAEAGLVPSGILNTHSHADHHGGNAFILKRFPELKIFAPPLEDAVITHPILEPLTLFGARPPRELQGKFLLAPPSPARLAPEPGLCRMGGADLELIEVAGHASLMYAVRVGEVLYAADALFGPDALSKHPLTFCADSGLQKASAAKLAELEGCAPCYRVTAIPRMTWRGWWPSIWPPTSARPQRCWRRWTRARPASTNCWPASATLWTLP